MQKNEEDDQKQSLVDVVAPIGIERNDALILRYTYRNPRTMPMICTVLGIPVMECHRRIRKLMSLNLIKKFTVSSSQATLETKGKVFYAANREKVEIMANDGKIRIKLRRRCIPDGSVFQFA